MNDLSLQDTRAEAGDAAAVRDMVRAFRRRHVEPVWEQMNQVDPALYAALWQGLADTGLTLSALPEADGGIPLDAPAHDAALQELGSTAPALGAALVAHLAAQALLVEAGGGHWPAASGAPATAALALLASPLDRDPASRFALTRAGDGWHLTGAQRVMLPATDWLVVPAEGDAGRQLCLLPAGAPGLSFAPTPSSHGLCLLPFGELRAHGVQLADAQVFDWPASGQAANFADGLLTALVAGMLAELALRAMDYARQRPQAGKMISEHHAVQQMVGPIEMARRPLHALAIATLAHPRAGDGSASAFAIQIARRSALDAIQTFGGYGYMEDYRVERYLRDANTLETFWIHAAQRERDVAVQRCAALARGEIA